MEFHRYHVSYVTCESGSSARKIYGSYIYSTSLKNLNTDSYDYIHEHPKKLLREKYPKTSYHDHVVILSINYIGCSTEEEFHGKKGK